MTKHTKSESGTRISPGEVAQLLMFRGLTVDTSCASDMRHNFKNYLNTLSLDYTMYKSPPGYVGKDGTPLYKQHALLLLFLRCFGHYM